MFNLSTNRRFETKHSRDTEKPETHTPSHTRFIQSVSSLSLLWQQESVQNRVLYGWLLKKNNSFWCLCSQGVCYGAQSVVYTLWDNVIKTLLKHFSTTKAADESLHRHTGTTSVNGSTWPVWAVSSGMLVVWQSWTEPGVFSSFSEVTVTETLSQHSPVQVWSLMLLSGPAHLQEEQLLVKMWSDCWRSAYRKQEQNSQGITAWINLILYSSSVVKTAGSDQNLVLCDWKAITNQRSSLADCA